MTGAIDLSNITGIILIFMSITDKIRKFLDVTPKESRDVVIYLKLAEHGYRKKVLIEKEREKNALKRYMPK